MHRTVTVADVRALAARLRVSHGTLLKCAREIEENAALPLLTHMKREGLERLYNLLSQEDYECLTRSASAAYR